MRRILAALALVIACSCSPLRAANVADFVDFTLRGAANELLLPGRLYVPPEASAGGPRPLILFLHGAGESGTNNTAQVNGNIDNLLAEAKRRGAFLFAPQTNGGWASMTFTSRTATMVDRALAEYNVDTNRLYVTGLSMGGGGVWDMMNRYGERFAAAVPICGVGPSADFVLGDVLHEPIWAFHGRFDTTVSANVTRNMINSFLAAVGQPAPTYPPLNTFGAHVQFDFPPLDLHYTDMRGGHGIWGEVYSMPQLYDWLFAHGVVPEPATIGLVAMCGVAAVIRGRYIRRPRVASRWNVSYRRRFEK